jgi:hypothetical protein
LPLRIRGLFPRQNTLAKEVTENLEKFELGIAFRSFTISFGIFCDWYN